MIYIPSNEFWGKKYGFYSPLIPKGHKEPWGFVIEVPRGSGTGRKGGVHSGASGSKLRWYPNRVIKKGK